MADGPLPNNVREGLSSPWFAFVNANERPATENPLTPIPASDEQTVYLLNPATGERVEIMSMPYATGDRIYWSPDGRKMLTVEPAASSTGTQVGGLYLLNLRLGISLRLLDIRRLNPRGIPEHHPVGRGQHALQRSRRPPSMTWISSRSRGWLVLPQRDAARRI